MNNSQFIDIRRELHQIPELGFEEWKTQEYLLSYIKSLPQQFIAIDTWKTGIFVKVQGSDPTKVIAYRADIDGLPMEEETNLTFKSKHEGKMHGCGHDFHMSIALGVLTYFANNQPKETLLFIFQPAEEGPGGAQPMLNSDYLKANRPDMIIALHIAPEYPVGTVATRKGLLFANTSELFIDFVGKGGHAAYPQTANDMVVASSYFVTQLQSIVSRNIDPLDSAVVTIGKITGGTKQNIIAEKARVEGTIRTLSLDSMGKIKDRIGALVKGIEQGFECSASIDYGSNYCQVYNNEAVTDEFISFLKKKSNVNFVECNEAMTGEDFGYFLEEIPGFMFWLGVNSDYGLHSGLLNPDEDAIPFTIDLLVDYLKSV
ncbi:N-acetyldiaminopimelate deacetylase [Anaerobacillus alkalidiazotrophicus]|uniref:N-acetyldiaminopimelate deacetylase n=1 Tax=Anaerobacillus alkalidiazotrophicus TaxID=472963 RepID=A0A1S2M468_9BACI|nr:N-acetyldiaminopimelate deacetylase [Anaerobacillus alkalidiazotrophicus]OIJ18717.1 N-acetyldiaminopimelate deacetylase [Anaerobacillus alkalidiazotrophicus]